jgi:hypothetical protein
MRIGREAPGGGAILSVGISATFEYGFPPPRIVNSGAPTSQRDAEIVLNGFVPVRPLSPLDVR